jgi:hypothetical protein
MIADTRAGNTNTRRKAGDVGTHLTLIQTVHNLKIGAEDIQSEKTGDPGPLDLTQRIGIDTTAVVREATTNMIRKEGIILEGTVIAKTATIRGAINHLNTTGRETIHPEIDVVVIKARMKAAPAVVFDFRTSI